MQSIILVPTEGNAAKLSDAVLKSVVDNRFQANLRVEYKVQTPTVPPDTMHDITPEIQQIILAVIGGGTIATVLTVIKDLLLQDFEFTVKNNNTGKELHCKFKALRVAEKKKMLQTIEQILQESAAPTEKALGKKKK